MRIVFITMQFPTPSETFCAGDIQTLSELGHEVHVFGLRPNHPKHKALVNQLSDPKPSSTNNFKISGFAASLGVISQKPIKSLLFLIWVIRHNRDKPSHLIKSLALLPSVLSTAIKTIKLNPDIVHLFWGHYPSMVGEFLKRLNPEQKVTLFLGAYDLSWRYGGTRAIEPKIDHIFTHSYANLKTINDFFEKDCSVTVIHRGTSAHRFFQTSSAKTSSPKPIDTDLLHLFFAGRLKATKRADLTLRILKILQERDYKSKLTIAGEGPELGSLRSLSESIGVSNEVIFLGHISHNSLLNNLADCEYVLIPSEKEGERLPNIAKEAMALGKICISSNTPGIDELIQNGFNGYIINDLFPETASDLITELEAQPSKKSYIKMNAMNTISENFDSRKKAIEYLKIWKNLKGSMTRGDETR